MKTRMSLLIALLLVLPLVLAACGGGPASNAEKFIKAAADGDEEEAEKYLCDDPQDGLGGNSGGIEGLKDVSCEEDGDNVRCEIVVEEDDIEQTVIIVYGLEDGKICSVEDFKVE